MQIKNKKEFYNSCFGVYIGPLPCYARQTSMGRTIINAPNSYESFLYSTKLIQCKVVVNRGLRLLAEQ